MTATVPGHLASLLVAMFSLVATPTWAISLLELDIGDVAGADWHVRSARFALQQENDGSFSARLRIAEAASEAVGETWTNIEVSCPELDVTASAIRCDDAQIRADSESLGPQILTGRLGFDLDGTDVSIAIEGGSIAGSTIRISAEHVDGSWRGELDLPDVDLSRVLALIARYLPDENTLDMTGALAVVLHAEGTAATPDQIGLKLDARNVTASNKAGTMATDSLDATLRLEASRDGPVWRGHVEQQADGGQAYAEPVFVDLGALGQRIEFTGSYDIARELLDVDAWQFEQRDVVSAQGSANLARTADGLRLSRLVCEQLNAKLPAAFDIYARPYLFATPLDALESAGDIEARLVMVDGAPAALSAKLKDVSIADKTGRFEIAGANGDVRWRDPDINEAIPPDWPVDSQIGWANATLMQLPAGAAEIAFVTRAEEFRLTKPFRLPLLDGELAVNRLEILGTGSETMQLLFDASLEPVSLTALTSALGWPVFAGTLSGRLPSLSYRDGVVELGGKMEAELFGGTLQVDGLRIVQPFGNLPQLFADIRFSGLDLETLTETFSFGRITGHVNGEILDLQMLQWEPVAFDARLESTRKDTAKRRISQRAVENISSVSGGGAAAALSSGVMGFFEDFAYDALGIRCRLQDGICNMGGISKADTGYYIVRGRGLPRIDVIGYASRVDWARLVEQLKAIEQSGAPVTK